MTDQKPEYPHSITITRWECGYGHRHHTEKAAQKCIKEAPGRKRAAMRKKARVLAKAELVANQDVVTWSQLHEREREVYEELMGATP